MVFTDVSMCALVTSQASSIMAPPNSMISEMEVLVLILLDFMISEMEVLVLILLDWLLYYGVSVLWVREF